MKELVLMDQGHRTHWRRHLAEGEASKHYHTIVADGRSGDSLGAMLLARDAIELIGQAD